MRRNGLHALALVGLVALTVVSCWEPWSGRRLQSAKKSVDSSMDFKFISTLSEIHVEKLKRLLPDLCFAQELLNFSQSHWRAMINFIGLHWVAVLCFFALLLLVAGAFQFVKQRWSQHRYMLISQVAGEEFSDEEAERLISRVEIVYTLTLWLLDMASDMYVILVYMQAGKPFGFGGLMLGKN